MDQQIAISGLGGQGVLFITRLLAEAALVQGLDVLSSETHGMAMRGGAVVSHLKVGRFWSPLIRAGQADTALYLAEENLAVHPHLIGPGTRVVLNAPSHKDYDAIDAGRLAEETVGRRKSLNLVLVGFAIAKGALFTDSEAILDVLQRISANPAQVEANRRALEAGINL